jgi:hypothetical protein
MVNRLRARGRIVHVRFEGQSRDVVFDALDVGGRSSDQAIRQALASYFDVPVHKLASRVIERHANNNHTVRPQAMFG